MKRVLLLEGLLFLYVGILPAQDQSPARVLDRFLDHVKEAPAMKMDFLWNQTVEGTMVLQGNLFVVHLDEFHVYCNGKEKWYYNEGIDQWEMVPHDKNSADILDNPGAFFLRLRDDFYLSPVSIQKEGQDNTSLWELTLVPHSTNSVFSYVIIQLETDGLQPRFIRYGLSDGAEYTIQILTFKTLSAFPSAFFTPDVSSEML
ncbi:MAG: outer membrane lipoprotein carrier protein LolA [Bacteroidales bacterium]|nr:outer membrane lipoprotein carrier protein LolA [Bacteroidales bacterium]